MKILLFGCNGQVGWELQRTLAPLGTIEALDRPDLDLVDAAALEQKILTARPAVVVNAAAYTAVDRAEQEPRLAHAVNGRAPGVMAEACKKGKAGLIHFSTDYVFDGKETRPYAEEDAPNPLNQYGLSKLAGEQAVRQAGQAYLILRTSWVYSLRGDSFVTKVLAWSRREQVMRIVADQTSSPTWSRFLAEAVAILLGRAMGDPFGYLKDSQGLYHLACSGQASRLEWAQAILRLDPNQQEQVTSSLEPAASREFTQVASRPAFSALDCGLFSRTFGLAIPSWEHSLALAMQEK